jgi:hypothetical protein
MPIRLKRGTTVPTAANLVTGEVAINTTNGFAYTKTDGGSVVQIGATTDLSGYAPLNSPALTGVPTAPTATVGTSTSQIATTNFVQTAVAGASVSAAQTLITEVRNTTGATLAKGTVVYVSGAGANKPLAIKAQANLEATSAFTLGLVQTDILNNSNGFVVTSGAITGLNTQAFTEGTLLYLSPTVAGAFTSTKPSAPDQLVFLGIVTTSSTSQGAIEVSIQNGYELDELHDVLIGTKADKDLLAYESATGLFKNKSAATLGIAELAGATFLGKVITPASTTTNAGFNIGAGSAPTSPVAGDIWMQTAGNYLYYRAPAGVTYTLAMQQFSNTFSAPQIIDTTSNTLAGLRVTQKGTQPAIVVEDSLNPDTTAFVVDANGNVGVGVNPATWTAVNKIEVIGGITTTGGRSILTPADLNTPSLNLGATSINSSPASAQNGDIWITNATSPKLAYKTGGVNYYAVVANSFNTFTGGVAVTGSSASQAQLAVSQTGTAPALQVTTTGAGNALVVEDSTSPDTTSFIINADGNVGIGVATGFTPVGKLDVAGTITCTTAADGTNSTVAATTAFVKSAIVPAIQNYDYDASIPYQPSYVQKWNSVIRISSSSNQSIQLPTDAQSAAPVGTQVVFLQLGAGRLDFTPTNGNTVMSSGGKYITANQYSVMTAIKTASNEWLIAGDLNLT